MRRYLKLLALGAVLALAATACGGGGDDGGTTGTSGPSGATGAQNLQKGGTLRVWEDSDVTAAFDPQKEYYQVSFAYYRCCLLRTLLSYNGKGPDAEGDKIFPDLAAEEPTISDDGLTWTFKLKQGIHYAPPLQDVEITASDFIRAMMREATPEVAAGYGFYYSVIDGFDAYSAGDAYTITGMVAVDDYTLEIHLTEPAGDLGYRMAMAAAAPIPPNPTDPNAPLGVADGHNDDYGRFLVSSGAYMFEGSENMDFSLPAKDQEPAAGYQPGKLISLVRNPSWVADGQDDLRPAWVDAISVEICPGCDQEVAEKKVEADEIDTIFANGVAAATARTFSTDPNLEGRYFVEPGSGNYYISMNLAVPPFDDVHVRKAVNFAVDKEGWRRLSGGEASGEIGTYFTPPGLLGGLLEGYDPYATPNEQGADTPEGLQKAKDEMALSKYDSNGDGVCDAPECKGVLSVGVVGRVSEAQDALIAQNLGAIGIELDVNSFDNSTAYNKIFDPKNHIPINTFGGWLQDYPDAFTFYYFPMYGPNILDAYNTNYSMAGADPDQLEKYGYGVTEVSQALDTKIEECMAKTGDERTACWAEADKVLMEEVVPIVPLIFSNVEQIISSRVQNYTYSLFDNQMAYDQIALAPGSA
jgi:peptide/nickel transport system substrate-binding protein